MKSLRITNVQRGCVYDGRGVRTTFFLKGCHFSCPWCCNPETSFQVADNFFDSDECSNRMKSNSVICVSCSRKEGRRPDSQCPFGYVKPTSSELPLQEIVKMSMKDISLFNMSGGGVTFSGGEPLLQSYNLLDLLVELKKKNIDTALETTLAVEASKLAPLVDYIDEFIIDYKLQPCMNLYDEGYNHLISDNIQLISNTKRKRHRLVFIDGMETVVDDIFGRLEKFGIKYIELLKCHNLAQSKYLRLNIENKDFSASEEKMENFRVQIESKGITANILKI